MNHIKLLLIALLFFCILAVGIGLYSIFKPTSINEIQTNATNNVTTTVNNIEKPTVTHSTQTINVPATVVWKDTGINITGKTVIIKRVSGLWNSVDDKYDQNGEGVGYYPGTIMSGAKIGELIAKTDNGMERIGTQNTITGRGRLYLGINDVPGKYGDNHGELVVEITIK